MANFLSISTFFTARKEIYHLELTLGASSPNEYGGLKTPNRKPADRNRRIWPPGGRIAESLATKLSSEET